MRQRDRLFIASDANGAALLDIAWKAARKPARGGISNFLCIAEPLEALPAQLGRIADHVTVILPWGKLLRAIAAPDIASLQQIASLCLPGACVDVVFSFDCQRDAAEASRLGISDLNEAHITSILPETYRAAGLHLATAG
ncbi:MAG TPA: hypothetical protein VG498_05585, partial [Terriglobales bacterium]|nr:hypothetical protein [Terriglobales bacterium]